jgi:hypothetical protein
MQANSTMTRNEALSLISKLMSAAGVLSDCQEHGCSKFANDSMNAAKSAIFDVIERLDTIHN